MGFCINPRCLLRQNPDDIQFCQTCGTELIVKNRYRIVRSLLRDSHPYTEVFEVEDLVDNGARAVLKTLVNANNAAVVRLFEQERDLLHTLNHSGIPRYRDFFSCVLFQPERRELRCLVMEKIEGENLDDWLQTNEKITTETQALEWLQQLTTILLYVHKKNFFHRDLKPANIVLKPNGKLVLIDFGTARAFTNTVINGQNVTQVYSSGYTPPEQQAGYITPQSDFYALGRTFVHLLTGRHPHDLDLEHWQTETKFPTSAIVGLINCLMELQPEHRPQTAEAVLNAIDLIRSQKTAAPTQLNLASHRTVLQSATANFSSSPTAPPQEPTEHSTLSHNQPDPRSRRQRSLILLLGCSAIAGLLWAVIPRQDQQGSSPAFAPFATAPLGFPTATTSTRSTDDLISSGQKTIAESKIKLVGRYAELKQQGTQAFAQNQFAQAVDTFEQLRSLADRERRIPQDGLGQQNAKAALNDPETLIYLNNARVRRKGSPIYTIAVAAPVNLDEGIQLLQGVAQAQDEAVKQNTNLVVVIANDLNAPDQAKLIAQDLANRNEILAVIGHYVSQNTCEALPFYRDQKLPLISPTSSMVDLRSRCKDTVGVFFRISSTTAVEAKTLADHLLAQIRNDKPKVAVFKTKDERYSEDLADNFQQSVGDRATILGPFNLADRYSSPDVRAADALAVFPDGRTKTAESFTRAIEIIKGTQGNKLILGSETLYLGNVLSEINSKAGEKGLQQLRLATDWDKQQCSAKDFNALAETLWGGDLNRRSAQAYEAVKAVLETFKPNINRSGVLQALANQDFKVPSGAAKGTMISFDRNGDRRENTTRMIVTGKVVNDQPSFVLSSGACYP